MKNTYNIYKYATSVNFDTNYQICICILYSFWVMSILSFLGGGGVRTYGVYDVQGGGRIIFDN